MNICIDKLEFNCIIGILPSERKKKQKVSIKANIHFNDSNKILIDYAKLSFFIKKIFKKQKFYTIEKSLTHVSKKIRKKYPCIKKIYLKISKPNALKNCLISVSIIKKY